MSRSPTRTARPPQDRRVDLGLEVDAAAGHLPRRGLGPRGSRRWSAARRSSRSRGTMPWRRSSSRRNSVGDARQLLDPAAPDAAGSTRFRTGLPATRPPSSFVDERRALARAGWPGWRGRGATSPSPSGRRAAVELVAPRLERAVARARSRRPPPRSGAARRRGRAISCSDRRRSPARLSARNS